MIVAAGLSPAWQQIMLFDRLQVGEVNRAREHVCCASGKVVNVAVALAHLGADSQMISLGGGDTGAAIGRELASLGVRHQLIKMHWATRVCTTLQEADCGRTTELVQNAGPVTADELAAFAGAFAAAAHDAQWLVLTGSLPAGVPPELFHDLLGRTAAQCVLDIRGDDLLGGAAATAVRGQAKPPGAGGNGGAGIG